MNKVIPRVAAIHDLTGFGRCALSVIIPVLSTMGVQVCSLPTAILSNHPGGFDNYFLHDFTASMESYASSWKAIGIDFDCIYSGFLGSIEQVDIVSKIFEDFKTHKKQFIIVDPVMADNGKLYSMYSNDMPSKMRLLIEKADIITPNATEASFLIGEHYTSHPMNNKKMKYFLKTLSELGPESVVITSVKAEDGNYANIGYKRSQNTFWKISYEHIPVYYPGTGDIFSSVLTGALIQGETLPAAIERATRFISLAIKTTYEYMTPQREGVLLEKMLAKLNDSLLQHTFEEFY